MKTDAQLKDDVIEELRWDPQISDADVIGVGVKDGAMILSGQVPSYVDKMAAAQAAAASAPGVASVESHLVIAPWSPPGRRRPATTPSRGKEPR
jgi:osmotically-inducible protein OsmY